MATPLELSKTGEGRAQLLASGRLDAIAAECAAPLRDGHSTTPGLLEGVRTLRNSCAAGAPAAHVLLAHDIPQAAARFAAAANNDSSTQPLQLAVVQLLANLCAAGEEAAAAAWRALFPAHLERLLCTQQGAVHEAAALAVLSCVRHHPPALLQLTSPVCHRVWLHLLAPMLPQQPVAAAGANSHGATQPQPQPSAPTAATTAATAALAGNDSVCLLVKSVALQHNRLQQVLECLSPSYGSTPATATAANGSSSSPGGDWDGSLGSLQATEEQAVLLHIVAAELAAVPAACPLPGADSHRPAQPAQQQGQQAGGTCCWLACVVQLLALVWQQAVSAAPASAGVCKQQTPVAHVLEATLQVLKAVLARDEEADNSSSSSGGGGGRPSGRDIKAAAAAGISAAGQQLHGLGLVKVLLDMLAALGPPPKGKQEQQRQAERQQQQQQQQHAPAATSTPAAAAAACHQQPYAGYRADVVAVLANLVFEQPAIQDAVLAAGGMELLLASCTLDDASPLAREWALWGVRNMCQGNAAVQQHVSELQAVAHVHSPELARMGMQLELDSLTHKLKLVRRPGQEPQLLPADAPEEH